MAIVAFGAHALIWSRPTGCRFRSAGIGPSSDPSAAKTNEFSPTSTGLSESRLQLFIQTAAPVKLETTRKRTVPMRAPDTSLPSLFRRFFTRCRRRFLKRSSKRRLTATAVRAEAVSCVDALGTQHVVGAEAEFALEPLGRRTVGRRHAQYDR